MAKRKAKASTTLQAVSPDAAHSQASLPTPHSPPPAPIAVPEEYRAAVRTARNLLAAMLPDAEVLQRLSVEFPDLDPQQAASLAVQQFEEDSHVNLRSEYGRSLSALKLIAERSLQLGEVAAAVRAVVERNKLVLFLHELSED